MLILDDSARVIRSNRTTFNCSSVSGCSGSLISGEVRRRCGYL